MLKFLPFFFFTFFITGAYSLPAAPVFQNYTIGICYGCNSNDHDNSTENDLPCESEEVQEEEVQEPSLFDEFNINYILIGKMNCYHFKQIVFFAPFLNICSPPPESHSFSLLRA